MTAILRTAAQAGHSLYNSFITPVANKIGFGCCDCIFMTEDLVAICARTMEFPMPLDSTIVVHPPGINCHSTANNDGDPGLKWKSSIGYLAVHALGMDAPVEGLNAEGLSFGFLSLDGSKYQEIAKDQHDQALALMDVGRWILGTCATVEDVKKALTTGKVRIWGNFVKGLEKVPALHIAIHDATGKSLVIEFLKGKIVVYDNPLGMLTNNPPFKWHQLHVPRFNHLSPLPAKGDSADGPGTSFGTGMIGLPGDWTSISRFVRIYTMMRNILKPANAAEGVNMAAHILNAFDIPKGMIAVPINETTTLYETTRWVVIKDLANKIFYFRSDNDYSFIAIDLKKLQFGKNKAYNTIPVGGKLGVIRDVTEEFIR